MEIGQRDTGHRSTLSQINVTPFVDVMLVLLVIFMVAAPMMQQGLDVKLPEVAKAPPLEQTREPVTVTVQGGGRLAVNGVAVPSLEKLAPVLRQALDERREEKVWLEADRDVPYGRVVAVMGAIQAAGISQVGLVTQEPRH